MDILKIASFNDGEQGGNPAGVAFYDELPAVDIMQKIAFDVGFSETAFASPLEGVNSIPAMHLPQAMFSKIQQRALQVPHLPDICATSNGRMRIVFRLFRVKTWA